MQAFRVAFNGGGQNIFYKLPFSVSFARFFTLRHTNFVENLKKMEEELIKVKTVDVQPQGGLENLRRKMEELKGETLTDEAVLSAAEEYISKQEEMNNRLSEALAEDPRMAQAFADLTAGKRTAPGAFARFFGKSFMSAEEGTPEYEDMMKAEDEFRAEQEAATKAKAEYDANIEASAPVIAEFCKANGYDEVEFFNKLSEIVIPLLDGVYTKENLERLDKALRYDKDVEDAAYAGEVKGRNTAIRDMREDVGDGMAKVNSVASPVMPKKKRGNSLVEAALKA